MGGGAGRIELQRPHQAGARFLRPLQLDQHEAEVEVDHRALGGQRQRALEGGGGGGVVVQAAQRRAERQPGVAEVRVERGGALGGGARRGRLAGVGQRQRQADLGGDEVRRQTGRRGEGVDRRLHLAEPALGGGERQIGVRIGRRCARRGLRGRQRPGVVAALGERARQAEQGGGVRLGSAPARGGRRRSRRRGRRASGGCWRG